MTATMREFKFTSRPTFFVSVDPVPMAGVPGGLGPPAISRLLLHPTQFLKGDQPKYCPVIYGRGGLATTSTASLAIFSCLECHKRQKTLEHLSSSRSERSRTLRVGSLSLTLARSVLKALGWVFSFRASCSCCSKDKEMSLRRPCRSRGCRSRQARATGSRSLGPQFGCW